MEPAADQTFTNRFVSSLNPIDPIKAKINPAEKIHTQLFICIAGKKRANLRDR
jgi:hypothetical protein